MGNNKKYMKNLWDNIALVIPSTMSSLGTFFLLVFGFTMVLKLIGNINDPTGYGQVLGLIVFLPLAVKCVVYLTNGLPDTINKLYDAMVYGSYNNKVKSLVEEEKQTAKAKKR